MGRILVLASLIVLVAAGAGSAATPCERNYPVRDCELLSAQIAKVSETGISRSDAESIAGRCLDGGLTARQASRVLTLLVRARIAGLPKEALLNKLNEGLAKRIEPEAIMKAVEVRALNLRIALDVIREATTGNVGEGDPELIVLVANLLGAGNERGEIEEVLASLYTRDRKIDLVKVKEAFLR